ncbi:MAG: septal ring lytic transglycosylase RlpA family protein [Candidatus Solibacter sp.]
MRSLPIAAAIVVAAIAFAGCGHKKRPGVTATPRTPRTPVTVKPGDTEEGVASWYGNPYHGRQAANGEIYDMEKMTAAHRTLPFETWVRVYDLDNQRTTEVRITDRGPFIDGRIIDLSHAAARELQLIGPGVARVRVEVIKAPPGAPPGLFAVQVGAFRDRANAERVRSRMESRYGTARLLQRAENPAIWRVLVGAEASEADAAKLAERIRQDSDEKTRGLVVRIDSAT